MALLWWGIAAFLVTMGLAWVLLPLFGDAVPWRVEMRDADARRLVKREKAKALRRIKDLEHELEVGTIDQKDYERLRQAAMEEVVVYNRRLDDLAERAKELSAEAEPAAEKSEQEATP